MKFIDSHCHVHFRGYDADRAEVVERAREAGVGMIAVGTRYETSVEAVAFAEATPNTWAAIGIHPSHTYDVAYKDTNELPGSEDDGTTGEEFDFEKYEALARHPKVVAIGECGLDYFRLPENEAERAAIVEQQKAGLRDQILFATKVNKPLVIHCRDAHEDQITMLDEAIRAGALVARGVIHCFTGTAEEAARYHALGFYVSIPGIVTFAKNVADAVREIPLSQMIIETDSPYLAPKPHRGQRNEPAYVVETARAIAELKGITIDEVADVTTANAKKLFGI